MKSENVCCINLVKKDDCLNRVMVVRLEGKGEI